MAFPQDGASVYTDTMFTFNFISFQSPIERIQKQQEVLQYDVTKMKTRLKTLQTRTVRLEAMLKAVLSHHGIDVKPEIDEDDAELKWNPSDDEADRYIAG